ncbi:MAG TPA: LLM class flavin-dependent oxidoreductase [Solirubrobacteraceae bacterium]|nr:LLM class flavin-dependent oxidoreductase [Solirubrobacteraceae bacterium]
MPDRTRLTRSSAARVAGSHGDRLIGHISSNAVITRPLDGSADVRRQSLVTDIESMSRTRDTELELALPGHGAAITETSPGRLREDGQQQMSNATSTEPFTSPPARFGVLLPTFDPMHTGQVPPVIEAARHAEGLGFDAAWVGDHLWGHAPWLDSSVALAAAAAATERLMLGFSVMLLGLRPPAWAAKQIQSIDALSGGRLTVGVGVGGEYPEEFEAAGVPVGTRGKRVDEALSVLPDLLLGRRVDFDGQALAVHANPLAPAMGRLPRILIGGRGDVALRRAVRFGDGWLPMWLSPDQLIERGGRLRELAAATGRPEPSITLLILVHVDQDLERSRREAGEHLEGQYKLPLHVVERWAALGPPEHVAEELQRYLDAGAGELILMTLGSAPLIQYERLAEVCGLLRKTVARAGR